MLDFREWQLWPNKFELDHIQNSRLAAIYLIIEYVWYLANYGMLAS